MTRSVFKTSVSHGFTCSSSHALCRVTNEHLAQLDLTETRVSRRTWYPQLWTCIIATQTHLTVASGLSLLVATTTMRHSSDRRPRRQWSVKLVTIDERWYYLCPSLLGSTTTISNDDISIARHYYDHSSDGPGWHNQRPSLLWNLNYRSNINASASLEWMLAPLWNGHRWLHINWRWREYADSVEEEAEESTASPKRQRTNSWGVSHILSYIEWYHIIGMDIKLRLIET
jgi:hypothetical protein